MAERRQKIYWLFLLLNLNTAFSAPTKEDLEGAEANGYEADDGSFKIESRDVLGNIKGTYGYIDESGQIKRVSYNTNNGSQIIGKPETSSVVQRIPKINRTSSTTRRPNIFYQTAATQSTASSTPTLSTAKRRTTTTTPPSTTTSKYEDFVKAAVEASKSTTNKPGVYDHYPPRILLQQRPIVAGDDAQRNEGQLIRPDVSLGPTEIPVYRRKATLLENDPKLVNEESESRGNLLRRQLLPEKVNFDVKQHVDNLQQSHGDDTADVYSSSLTTGTARPLFTTLRPKYISSTIPVTIQRPSLRYVHYSNSKEDYETETETATEGIQTTTSSPLPVIQIPSNRDMSEALVAVPHPVHGRTVLIPLSQLENNGYDGQYNEYNRETGPIQQNYQSSPVNLPVYVRKYQPQRFRAVPVRVDENGFIREMPQYQTATTQYPLPVRMRPAYINDDEEINLIKPPVSTRDFQKLLEQLILRQSRLEQISHLTKRYQQTFGQRQRPIHRSNSFYQRRPDDDPNTRYLQQNFNSEQQNLYNSYPSFSSDSYTPARRVARLLDSQQYRKGNDDDDYLPPDVREMLLLKMLQLAINPALPLNIPDKFVESVAFPQRKRKNGARNVEILGEEADDDDTKSRGKR